MISELDSSTTAELPERQCTPVSPSRLNVETSTVDVSVLIKFYVVMNNCILNIIIERSRKKEIKEKAKT